MFKSIVSRISQDTDYPERQYTIDILTRVLESTVFDHLEHGFHEETRGSDQKYVPLRERRPSVIYNLCRTVVDDSVSLLFSEGHFPDVNCDDETMREALASIIKETQLNQVMIEAATTGSVGSVAVLMRVLRGRIFFQVMNTAYLTPVFDPAAPDTLLSVREQYKVKGSAFAALGYKVEDENADYWFICDYTDTQEVYYQPHPVEEKKKQPRIDKKRTKTHGLGFVPMVWIKNLPGRLRVPGVGLKGGDCDGASTFTAAIDTMVEISYQLSQSGRGLKYSADPTLVLKEPAGGDGGQIIKGANNALVIGENGDAKLLEVSGNAANAVIEYCKALRQFAMEAVHGNRADADKISAAQSGRAMELMNQALIWLADRLRISYGEGALLELLRMVQRVSNKLDLVLKDGSKIAAMPMDQKIALRWPEWYAPTANDRLETANTLKTHVDSGTMSRETAVQSIAADYDIEDVPAEMARIEKEQQAQAERDAATQRNATIVE